MVILKGIPALLSPELLFALAGMGHGDEIVLADANFPAVSVSRCGPTLVRADGLGIPALLEAILKLLPLDTYVKRPAAVMDLVEDDQKQGLETPVWAEYKRLLANAGSEGNCTVWEPHPQERCAFSRGAGVILMPVPQNCWHLHPLPTGDLHPSSGRKTLG
ncbi:fucose mutarotase isoform X1 [Ambystoma mexicanum]|uniref:fucose mutarotase isoform X1 n=1 Tax=Ambystoma mexicanum TaxID=8296 RepID=UPI0037E6FAE3